MLEYHRWFTRDDDKQDTRISYLLDLKEYRDWFNAIIPEIPILDPLPPPTMNVCFSGAEDYDEDYDEGNIVVKKKMYQKQAKRRYSYDEEEDYEYDEDEEAYAFDDDGYGGSD